MSDDDMNKDMLKDFHSFKTGNTSRDKHVDDLAYLCAFINILDSLSAVYFFFWPLCLSGFSFCHFFVF